jgi:predicted lipid-binding transport protein (Tim44 family)
MKTILRIIIILLVASVVAGAFSLAINSGITTSNTAEQTSFVPSANNQAFQPMTRPEGGDREGGSITGGLAGMLSTLAKITGITIFILAIQKAFSLIGKHKLISAQQ